MYSLVLLQVCSFLIVGQLLLAADLAADCYCFVLLSSSIWTCGTATPASSRTVPVGWIPAGALTSLLACYSFSGFRHISLDEFAASSSYSLHAAISQRLFPDRDYFLKGYNLLVDSLLIDGFPPGSSGRVSDRIIPNRFLPPPNCMFLTTSYSMVSMQADHLNCFLARCSDMRSCMFAYADFVPPPLC